MRSLANRSWPAIEAHPPTLHSQLGLGKSPLLTKDLDKRFEMHARAALLSRLTWDWAPEMLPSSSPNNGCGESHQLQAKLILEIHWRPVSRAATTQTNRFPNVYPDPLHDYDLIHENAEPETALNGPSFPPSLPLSSRWLAVCISQTRRLPSIV